MHFRRMDEGTDADFAMLARMATFEPTVRRVLHRDWTPPKQR